MKKQVGRSVHPTGTPAMGNRESKLKTEELLIEEILKAAGLDPLD
jgi:hypothetical protein